MNMMTPVTGNTPSAAITGIAPVRPVVEPTTSFAQGDPGEDRSGRDQPDEGRDRGAETTLRYKFDWLVQRQVRAGTIDPDEAAEMIRLFDRTLADATAPDPDAPETAVADAAIDRDDRDPAGANRQAAAETDAQSTQRGSAAAALLDRMRERFGIDGPYDDHGGQNVFTPLGTVVDEHV